MVKLNKLILYVYLFIYCYHIKIKEFNVELLWDVITSYFSNTNIKIVIYKIIFHENYQLHLSYFISINF